MATSSRKQCVKTGMVMALITTLFFACSLIWYNVPLSHVRNNKVKRDITVKQNEIKRWGVVPGNLGYDASKTVDISSAVKQNDPNTKFEHIEQNKYSRDFINTDYVHTESVVNYNVDTKWPAKDESEKNDEKTIELPNLISLSVWSQLQKRPAFLNQFKALTQMKDLFKKTDPYHRMFVVDAIKLGFSNQANVFDTVLFGLSAESKNSIYTDAEYGLNTPQTLFKWTQAMNGGSESAYWTRIQDHFSGLTDFNDNTMLQIAGPFSQLHNMNMTFSSSLARGMKDTTAYHNYAVEIDQFVKDQWANRKITKCETVPLYQGPDKLSVTSIYDFYKDLNLQFPDNINVVNFQPELNYYFEEVMGFKGDDVYLTPLQVDALYEYNVDSTQTLFNPVNLHYINEKYDLGEWEAIGIRIDSIAENRKITLDQVHGVGGYLKFVQSKQMPADYGQNDWSSSGSLISAYLNKASSQISGQMKMLTTRYLAAFFEINTDQCSTFMNKAVTNATKSAEVCAAFPFNNVTQLNKFVQAYNGQPGGMEWINLMAESDLTSEELTTLFDISDTDSFGHQVLEMNQMVSTTQFCASADACTLEELTFKQMATGNCSMVQPALLKGNHFLGKASLCMTEAWDEGTWSYECPELVHAPNTKNLDLYVITQKLFDTTFGYNFNNQVASTAVTKQYLTGSGSEAEQNARFEPMYGTPDFLTFYRDILLAMIPRYLFGEGTSTGGLSPTPGSITIPLDDYVDGYDEPRIRDLYNETDMFEGREVFLRSRIEAIQNEQSPSYKSQVIGILTGALSRHDTARVRFVNDRNYANFNLQIYNGQAEKPYTLLPVSPTGKFDFLNETYNGMQYAPNVNDTLRYYDDKARAVIMLKEKEGVEPWDWSPDESQDPVRVKEYELEERHGAPYQTYADAYAFTQGLPIYEKPDSRATARVLVSESTGLVVSSTWTRNVSLSCPFTAKTNEENFVFLPNVYQDVNNKFPMSLANISESMTVDQSKFNDHFAFVHTNEVKVHNTSLFFLIAMILSALVFIGITFVYCTKFKNQFEDEEDRVAQQINNHQ